MELIEKAGSDESIATSDVLSEKDDELLDSSDRDQILKAPSQIDSRATPASHIKSDIKSSTVKETHTDVLSQLRPGRKIIYF